MVGQRPLHWACRHMALRLTATHATLLPSKLVHKCGGMLEPAGTLCGLPVTGGIAQHGMHCACQDPVEDLPLSLTSSH